MKFFETRSECIFSILKQLLIKCEQIINYKYICIYERYQCLCILILHHFYRTHSLSTTNEPKILQDIKRNIMSFTYSKKKNKSTLQRETF